MKDQGLSWQSKAAAKKASIQAQIPPEWRLTTEDLKKASHQRNLTGPFTEQYLSPEEVAITRQDTTSIVKRLRDGKWTAREVTRAFCKAAAIAHQINNCLHEIFFEQALLRAAELDDYFAANKGPIGPLHGLPVSLKDQFHVKGVDTTMGYVGWINTYQGSKDPSLVHQMDSQIVLELKELGAVFYCKTSLPQTLLLGETVNNIIGRTMNPVNQNLSCGGSSGGEAALQALRGSSVGLGTDIGGSVRIPAGFCGTFAIKPSSHRFSYRDVANVVPGQTTYPSSVGFMATSLDALSLLMSSVLSKKPWSRDPYVAAIPWRQAIVDKTLLRAAADGSAREQAPLKIGILWSDEVVTPQPPIARGLRLVIKAIKDAGHKVVDWEPPSHKTARRIHVSILKADGGYDINKQLNMSGEPLIPQLRSLFTLRPPMPLIQYQALTIEGCAYENLYSDYWRSTAKEDGQMVDAVIMPVAPHAAVIPGKYYHSTYTEVFNLLDYSAVVIPVTKADKTIDVAPKDFTPVSDTDAKNWKAYNAEIYHGAPVAVQIVCRKLEEEKVYAVAKIVQAILETEKSKSRG